MKVTLLMATNGAVDDDADDADGDDAVESA
jgi:hypothetical protein